MVKFKMENNSNLILEAMNLEATSSRARTLVVSTTLSSNHNREDTMVALTDQARAKTAKANNHLVEDHIVDQEDKTATAVMMIKTLKDNNKDTETE